MTFEQFLLGWGLKPWIVFVVIAVCVLAFVTLNLKKINSDRVKSGKSSLVEKAKEAGEAVKEEATHVGGMAQKLGEELKSDVSGGVAKAKQALEDLKKED